MRAECPCSSRNHFTVLDSISFSLLLSRAVELVFVFVFVLMLVLLLVLAIVCSCLRPAVSDSSHHLTVCEHVPIIRVMYCSLWVPFYFTYSLPRAQQLFWRRQTHCMCVWVYAMYIVRHRTNASSLAPLACTHLWPAALVSRTNLSS